ncbi:ATP-binding protein [Cohaesibacter haloalkalitolerans]|uniref:ATP-binding protein n=1 Tax=Cohaesibacter haloalkalitolerans TaxID=1162980 RepID=UPI001FE05540|nr:ATP-binding protein [Cohaesibacter haloalkalitolerans]
MPTFPAASLARPFLTLTAHPTIGAVLLDSRPAWVWNTEGNRILWANAAGLAFFSETSMESLLSRSFGDVHPARRHLARLARNARPDTPTLDQLRFFLGLSFVTLSCLCKKLTVEGETVLLVLSSVPLEAIESSRETAFAPVEPTADLLKALASDKAMWAALLDKEGQLLASSEDFLPFGENAVALGKLLARVDGDERVGEGSLPFCDSQTGAAVARVSDDLRSRYLLLVHNPASPVPAHDPWIENPFADLESPNQLTDEASFSAAEADIFDDQFGLDELSEIRNKLTTGLELLQRAEQAPFNSDAGKPSTLPFTDPVTGKDVEPQRDRSVTNLADFRQKQAATGRSGDNVYPLRFPPKGKDASSSMSIQAASDYGQSTGGAAGPFHFVWESDEVGRFKFVSDELAMAVGRGNADIVGMRWSEIAERFGMDRDGTIARGFASCDTWASLDVWWPVEGEDCRIAVELTGLPIYGRLHGFQGYRGFGLCRPADVKASTGHGPEAGAETETATETENTQQESGQATVPPHLAQIDDLISADLLEAARNAVATTTELISPDDQRGRGTSQEASVETTGVIAVCEDNEKGLEDQPTNQPNHTEEAAKAAADGSDLTPPDQPASNRQNLVGTLLSGNATGVREVAAPSSADAGDADVRPESGHKLSAGEEHAFKEIADVLSDETFESRLPAEDLDDDYEDPAALSDEEAEEEEEQDEVSADPAPSFPTREILQQVASEVEKVDKPAAIVPRDGGDEEKQTAPEPSFVRRPFCSIIPPRRKEDHLVLPWQSANKPLSALLEARERKEDAHKSAATSKALLDILSIDPRLKQLHDQAAQAKEQAVPPAAPMHPAEQQRQEEPDVAEDNAPSVETATPALQDEGPQTPPLEPDDTTTDTSASSQTDPLAGSPVDSVTDFTPQEMPTPDETEVAPLEGPNEGESLDGLPPLDEVVPLEAGGNDAPEFQEPQIPTPGEALGDELFDEPVVSENHFVISAMDDEADNAPVDQEQASPVAGTIEGTAALTAAAVAGVAALGAESLWDRQDKASPLIDMLNKLQTAIIVSAKSRVLFASKTALRLLDFASEDALDEAGGMEGLFSGRPGDWLTKTNGRTTLRTENGSPISVQANISSIAWGDQPAAMLCFEETPVTPPSIGVSEEDEKIAELEAILDTATDGVLVLDRDGNILRMNHSAEALFEVDRHKVAGEPFISLLAQESHKDALAYLERLRNSGLASLINGGQEVIGQLRSGGLIPLVMTMGRVSIPGTNRFCAVLRDVTEWKRTQEELIAQKLRAERASKKKSEFLAKVSHEIRTPLNAIIGFSEVMMEERFGAIGQERYKDYLKDIKISGTHIISLLNDLLDLSKVEAGKMELQFEAVPLNGMVTECVGIMQPQANRSQIIIRTSASSRLPDVVADNRSLRQIILNILSNAVKFNHPGGQVIVSTTQQDSGEVILRIRDTGIGMSKEDMKRALEPFRQVSPTTRSAAEGTGLGLPLTKALIEANKARLNLSSERGHGTLVEVIFPPERVVESPEEELPRTAEPVN